MGAWTAGSRKNKSQPKTYIGSHNQVDLESDKIYLELPYIGDFHVHPYQKKYGESAAIGPSSGDWSGWHKYFPTHKKCGVFVVASGDQIFLIIFRKKLATLTLSKIQDAQRLSNAVFNLNKYQFQDFAVAQQAGKWDDYRNLLDQHIPHGAKWHEEDVHNMNREFAELNGCEYYRGTLVRNGVTYVYLKSNRIMGNWLTARIWSKTNDPWIHKRIF